MQVGDMRLGRRAFLRNGTLVLGAMAGQVSFATQQESVLRVGLITDLHYADKPPAGTRHYRETLGKLADAATEFERRQPNFMVELGDLIDAADSVATEERYLATINREFSAICKDRHYVLGNHCVDMLKKEEFLGGVEQEKSYYSFDRAGFHFIVLDACFRSDGEPYGRKNSKWTDSNIPAEELDWLKADVAATDKKIILFAHQRLDVANSHSVKNCSDVRTILEASGKVLAVLQGHSHKNELQDIEGIHYCTLVAMIEGSGLENNGYSILSIHSNNTLQIEGFRKQLPYSWQA